MTQSVSKSLKIFDNSLAINKDLLKKYTEVWDVIKHKIKNINGGKETDYRKDYIKIKVESNDDLPLNEPPIFYEIQNLSHLFLKKMINCIQKFFRQNFVCKRNVKNEI